MRHIRDQFYVCWIKLTLCSQQKQILALNSLLMMVINRYQLLMFETDVAADNYELKPTLSPV